MTDTDAINALLEEAARLRTALADRDAEIARLRARGGEDRTMTGTMGPITSKSMLKRIEATAGLEHANYLLLEENARLRVENEALAREVRAHRKWQDAGYDLASSSKSAIQLRRENAAAGIPSPVEPEKP